MRKFGCKKMQKFWCKKMQKFWCKISKIGQNLEKEQDAQFLHKLKKVFSKKEEDAKINTQFIKETYNF